MADFTPVVFKDIGKNIKDLFSKKYTYDHSVQISTKTTNGFTWTSSSKKLSKDQSQASELKTKYKNSNFGSVEGVANTDGNLTAEIKAEKLADGLTVKISGKSLQADTDKEQTGAGIDVSFRKDFAAVTGAADYIAASNTIALKTSAVIGFEGLSVGGEFAYNVASEKNEVKDYNAGFEYNQNDQFLFSAKTEKKTEKINVSYFHKISSSVNAGGQVAFDVSDLQKNPQPKTNITFGGDYKFDADTVVKAQVSDDFQISVAFEQKLRPQVRLGLASTFQYNDPSKYKFGVALALGELPDD